MRTPAAPVSRRSAASSRSTPRWSSTGTRAGCKSGASRASGPPSRPKAASARSRRSLRESERAEADASGAQMKVVVAFGTRPEAVKLAPVVSALTARGATVVTVATSQHRELLAQALQVFGIVPDRDLDVMRPRQRLADLTARILPAFTDLLHEERPDVVVVQGDTTSTFVCALAAFYAQVRVAHVEAGLRSHDIDNPFPEEANRRLTAMVARWHFAPTANARANLL